MKGFPLALFANFITANLFKTVYSHCLSNIVVSIKEGNINGVALTDIVLNNIS